MGCKDTKDEDGQRCKGNKDGILEPWPRQHMLATLDATQFGAGAYGPALSSADHQSHREEAIVLVGGKNKAVLFVDRRSYVDFDVRSNVVVTTFQLSRPLVLDTSLCAARQLKTPLSKLRSHHQAQWDAAHKKAERLVKHVSMELPLGLVCTGSSGMQSVLTSSIIMRGLRTSSFAKVALALCLAPSLTSAASPVCYDGSGNQNTSMVACDASASPGGCCPFEYACLSNGLCQSPFGGLTAYSNFGCTESGGSSGTCSVGVITCNDNSYVCYNSGQCTDTDLIFTLPVGTVVTTIPPRSVFLAAMATSSIAMTQSTMATSTIATPISATLTPSPSSASHSNSGIAIGVGLGLGVGIGLIVAVALGFWCRRRQKKSESGPVVEDDPHQPVYLGDSKAPPVYGSQPFTAAPYAMPMEMESSRMPSELDSTESKHSHTTQVSKYSGGFRN
nr:hypothetical protein CFP56_43858 [Quercus suber]